MNTNHENSEAQKQNAKNKNKNKKSQKLQATTSTTSGIIVVILFITILLIQTCLLILKVSGPLSAVQWVWLFAPTIIGLGAYLIMLLASILTVYISAHKLNKMNKSNLHDMAQAKLIQQDLLTSLAGAFDQYLSEQRKIFQDTNEDFLDQIAFQLNSFLWPGSGGGGSDPALDPFSPIASSTMTATISPDSRQRQGSQQQGQNQSQNGTIITGFANALNEKPICTSIFDVRKQFRSALCEKNRSYSTIVHTGTEGVEVANLWVREQFKDAPLLPSVKLKARSENAAIWVFSIIPNPSYRDENGNPITLEHHIPPKAIPVNTGAILVKDGHNLAVVTLEGQNIFPESFKTASSDASDGSDKKAKAKTRTKSDSSSKKQSPAKEKVETETETETEDNEK